MGLVSTPSGKIIFSTVRLETDKGVGTAFFFNFKRPDGNPEIFLITNKHVVRDANSLQFVCHEKDTHEAQEPNGKWFHVVIPNFKDQWIDHPDKEVDLCAIPFNGLYGQAHTQGKFIFFVTFSEESIPQDGSLQDAFEEVMMIGYPLGLYDQANNLPIVRRGTTASHPAVNFQGKPMGAVDIACFPGSSGSPVLLYSMGSYVSNNTLNIGGWRMLLLGVLSCGPQFTAEGKIVIVNIPTGATPVLQTSIPVHLGYYVKSSQILAFRPKV